MAEELDEQKQRKANDLAEGSTLGPPVVEPGRMDILCGRGKSITAHPGNQRFREAIIARRDEYQQTKRRDDKSRITEEIVDSLRSGPDPSR